jgi:diguanylate cyclase
MTEPIFDSNVAHDQAERALAEMARYDVSPTPRNYAVWLSYAARRSPALIRAIEETIASGGSFSSEQLDDLFVRHVADETQKELYKDAGRRLQEAVGHLIEKLGEATGQTRAYSKRLDAWSTELGTTQSLDRLREMLAEIAVDTQRVLEKNDVLEHQLMRSTGEVEELRRNLAAVRHEAMTDGLTGLANRKFFDSHLREATRVATALAEPLSLLLIDIDRFKQFNDTWGHQLGDKVLNLVARTLTDCVKGRDVTARFGGEEFAIVLEATSHEAALAVAEQIRTAMMRRKVVRKDSKADLGQVTVSIGVGLYRPGESVESLIERTDSALYAAKRAGRNRVTSERQLPAEAAD